MEKKNLGRTIRVTISPKLLTGEKEFKKYYVVDMILLHLEVYSLFEFLEITALQSALKFRLQVGADPPRRRFPSPLISVMRRPRCRCENNWNKRTGPQ